MKQISSRGCRREEPTNLAIAPERPRLLKKMAEEIYGTPLDVSRLAAELRWRVPLTREVLAGFSAGRETAPAVDSTKERSSSASPVILFQKTPDDAD